jgi:histidyl-tRNA synthetase
MPKKNTTAKDVKYLTHEHLDKIGEIPIYYGFSSYKQIEIKKNDIEKSKDMLDGDFIEEGDLRFPLHVEEKVALLRLYEEHMQEQAHPIMLYLKDSFKHQNKKGSDFTRYADLEILGNGKSIAEATLIQTACMMLKEEGYTDLSIDINSIGDKDSIARFTRELANYYRKHLNDLHPECRQAFKIDPLELLSCGNEKCIEINLNAPRAIHYLSEASRIHFQEVLEFLETLEIPYNINNNLIGNRKYCSETIFEIKEGEKTLAIGVRYDSLSKKIGFKKELPGISISLLIKKGKTEFRKELTKTKRPWVYFVQLGMEAKLLSLPVIEILRQHKIPVFQSLPKEKLGAQVSVAERMRIPYTMIMGKKEAVEKSVIVRHNDTRSQETVLISELGAYMKKLEK